MTAGLNLKVDIYRMTEQTDDVVGGAVPTGTVVHQNVPASLSARTPSQILLEQGIEVNRLYDLVVQGQSLDFLENYEVQVVWPTGHRHYRDRFVVMGVDEPLRRQWYGPLFALVRRVQRSRSIQ